MLPGPSMYVRSPRIVLPRFVLRPTRAEPPSRYAQENSVVTCWPGGNGDESASSSKLEAEEDMGHFARRTGSALSAGVHGPAQAHLRHA
ncbi:hypothetical protein EDB89DRAFT_2074203 [Lactarius sanguifluus]|nr:hypothetical protein EDB89DRAFT_2074203 [Lactarius sanguifluus]